VFRGALRHAPRRILQLLKDNGSATEYLPKPEDDLEMVVKVVFELMNLALYSQIALEIDPGELFGFWEEHLPASKKVWNSLLAAARAGDYDTLKSQICEII